MPQLSRLSVSCLCVSCMAANYKSRPGDAVLSCRGRLPGLITGPSTERLPCLELQPRETDGRSPRGECRVSVTPSGCEMSPRSSEADGTENVRKVVGPNVIAVRFRNDPAGVRL